MWPPQFFCWSFVNQLLLAWSLSSSIILRKGTQEYYAWILTFSNYEPILYFKDSLAGSCFLYLNIFKCYFTAFCHWMLLGKHLMPSLLLRWYFYLYSHKILSSSSKSNNITKHAFESIFPATSYTLSLRRDVFLLFQENGVCESSVFLLVTLYDFQETL